MGSFLVYKSSAGSGKTYTLVKEYLKIVIQNPHKVRNILAITFTNASAAEMKERVVDALARLTKMDHADPGSWGSKERDLLNSLTSELLLKAHEVIELANLALTMILHNYGDFNISTIDSFVHRVIRSFAFDLRLPLNFDVELDRDKLLKQAVDLLVSRAGSDTDLTYLLVNFLESLTEEEKGFNFEVAIAKMAEELMDERGRGYIERLKDINLNEFTAIHANLTQHIREFDTRITTIASLAVRLMEKSGIKSSDFYQKEKGIGGWFEKLAGNDTSKKPFIPNSYVIATIDQDKWTAAKPDPAVKSAVEKIKDELRAYYDQIAAIVDAGLNDYKLQINVRKNLYPVALLNELEKIVEKLKEENSFLHISDFNRKISEIVAVESAPFIYERIGERYQHYMIDEFQDTSGLQWQNILPLIDNSLAAGHLNLVVGDAKQAIYRWRNGDFEQFAKLPAIPPAIKAKDRKQWEGSLSRNYAENPLDTNYRSRPEVISFNNRFFDFAKGFLPESLQEVYKGHKQKSESKIDGGHVHIEFVEGNEESNFKDNTKQRIIAIIGDLQQQGYSLGDITILCRGRANANETARFLLEHGLNVISSESLLLTQSPLVNFMISVMKLVNHPDDHIALVEFLQFLSLSGKTNLTIEESLNFIRKKTGHSKFNSVEYDIIESYLQNIGIEFSFVQARFLNQYELAETIVRQFFTMAEADPFVAFFMEAVHEYTGIFVSSLSDFLLWWEENASEFSIVVPQGADAVQVMTIHKSKGLQFKVVIHPYADESFDSLSKKGEWVELSGLPGTDPLTVAWISLTKELESTLYQNNLLDEQGKTTLDVLNTTYVAFTRAVDRLYVLTKHYKPDKYSNSKISGLLHMFLKNNQLWDDEQKIYTLGENPECSTNVPADQPKKNEIGAEYKFGSYPSYAWFDKIINHSGRQALIKNETGEEGTDRGSRIHEIMEKIHTFADVDPVLERFFRAGQITRAEKDSLNSKIKAIIETTEIGQWYVPGLVARNECGMYDSGGNFHRADRVVLQNNSAVIIEYKTGNQYSGHIEQIKRYANIITEMGHAVSGKYLVYIDHGRVEVV